MRYDKQHKERTRRRLLSEAAAAIKTEGLDRLGVAALMSRAGLTHGGFYAHFKSRDELIDKAIEASIEQAKGKFLKAVEGRSPREGLAAYVDSYLSMTHVEQRDVGCPIAALSADMGRANGATRARFWNGAIGLADRMTALLEEMGVPPDQAAEKSRSALSEMVGAISLSRASTNADDAKQIVEASRVAVKRRLGVLEGA